MGVLTLRGRFIKSGVQDRLGESLQSCELELSYYIMRKMGFGVKWAGWMIK